MSQILEPDSTLYVYIYKGLFSFSSSMLIAAMSDYTPIYPPAPPTDFQRADANLTADQEQSYQHVLAHFSKPDYIIPGLEKGELIEAEKFWLVRLSSTDFVDFEN